MPLARESAATRAVALLIAAMAAVVVVSNILVQHLLGDWLTWGALTYPFAFLITDIANRLMGAAVARRVVFAGFLTGVACSVVAAGFGATTLRIAIASGSAFLVAQLLDVAIFSRLRTGAWWRAPLASSFIGSAVDTAIFFAIAFSAAFAVIGPNEGWALEVIPLLGFGPMAPLWVSLAVADFAVKIALALIALGPYSVIARPLSRA